MLIQALPTLSVYTYTGGIGNRQYCDVSVVAAPQLSYSVGGPHLAFAAQGLVAVSGCVSVPLTQKPPYSVRIWQMVNGTTSFPATASVEAPDAIVTYGYAGDVAFLTVMAPHP